MKRTKVLYIATSGRSGSTLLERMLGSLPGWCSLGELSWVFKRGIVDNIHCVCGERFHDCPFWVPVIERSLGGFDHRLASELDLQWREHRIGANLPMFVSRQARNRARDRAASVTEVLCRIYAAAAALSGAEVVVDSSKLPLRPAFLAGCSAIELSVVHLVRDPRAVAGSWLAAKPGEDGTALEASGVMKPTTWWIVTNQAVSMTSGDFGGRYAVLRYEDLVVDPRAALGRVGDLAGFPADLTDRLVDGAFRFGSTHAFSGNPDRFRTGSVPIRLDDRWRSRLRGPRLTAVSVLAAPWILRYGYPWRPDAPAGDHVTGR